MKTWRQFRAALVRLMEDGGVSRQQMLKAAESSMAEPRSSDTPDFGAIKRSTLYAYLKASDDPVGSDWDVIKNVLLCIASLAEKNKKPLDIDQNTWKNYWHWLANHPHRRPSPSDPNSWIGSWDGAADAALTHASAEEFIKWPQGGGSRLDELSQAVASLSAAYQPRLAKEAAQELVNAAQAELGAANPKTLAARHALAFWTGETGDSRLALDLTASLLSDCRKCLGPDHILTRLAALRKALWTCYTGHWREANRGYIEVVSSEVRRPDRDQHIWLLARWGMARTGGRTGNWRHADTELADLLPSVVETFGADHLATFSAEAAHAWAAGRAGRPEEARSRLEDLATRAETTLGPDHPVSLRIRTASAHWTHAAGSTAKALQLAASTREACESRMGTMHPLSIQAAEVEALCLLETDEMAALASLSDVLSRMTQLLGPDHPQTLQAMSNLAAARAAADGSGVNPKQFKKIAKRMGHTLGKEHPDTLRARANVAIAVLNTQGAVAALPLFRKTYASFSIVLGEGHPETAMSRDLLIAVEEQIPRPEAPRRVEPDKQHRSRGPSYKMGSHAGDPPSSDRAVKCDVDPVVWSSAPTDPGDRAEIEPKNGWTTPPTQQNGFDILAAVASLPVSTWSYIGEENVRHLGPMAQDWYAAFGLGADDRSIHMIDANGVAIVAMQALHRMVQSLQQEVDSLRSRLGTDEASKSRRDDKR